MKNRRTHLETVGKSNKTSENNKKIKKQITAENRSKQQDMQGKSRKRLKTDGKRFSTFGCF